VDIDRDTAHRFLTIAFRPTDWVAVFLKSYATGHVAQRIAPVVTLRSRSVQAWLARENRRGVNIFVSLNVLAPRRTSRRRSDVIAVRHVFLDADQNGPAVLAAVAARQDLPSPSYVLHTSPNRVHLLWRTEGFAAADVEALQKQLARELKTDPAATSCAQMTRWPGYWNHKYSPATIVTMESGRVDRIYRSSDFPPAPAATVLRPAVNAVHGMTRTEDVVRRVWVYAAAFPPAIAGQHGDTQTFRLCCRLVRGFALSDNDALAVLTSWNRRCQPPWSERQLIAKLRHARQYGREPIGGLLERQP
jgi:hypothetical protein